MLLNELEYYYRMTSTDILKCLHVFNYVFVFFAITVLPDFSAAADLEEIQLNCTSLQLFILHKDQCWGYSICVTATNLFQKSLITASLSTACPACISTYF